MNLDQKVATFFEKAKTKGYTLRVTSGYRTPEEQQVLYNQGRTVEGVVVTNAKGLPVCESDHCKGLAVDIVDRYKGYNIDWNLIGKLGKESGLLWGGDWAYPDKPHFYIKVNNKSMDKNQVIDIWRAVIHADPSDAEANAWVGKDPHECIKHLLEDPKWHKQNWLLKTLRDELGAEKL